MDTVWESMRRLWVYVEWGDAPTWIATVGALGALLIARRALSIEHAREDDRLEQSKAAQASKVVAWTVEDLELDQDKSSAQRRLHLRLGIPAPADGGIIVRNISELPVYSVDVIIYNGAPYEVARIPIGTVAPGEHRFTQHDLERNSGVDIVSLTTGHEYSGRRVEWRSVLAGVAFHDAGNHRWERDCAGRLEYKGIAGPPLAAGRDPGVRGWLSHVWFRISKAQPRRLFARRVLTTRTDTEPDKEGRAFHC